MDSTLTQEQEEYLATLDDDYIAKILHELNYGKKKRVLVWLVDELPNSYYIYYLQDSASITYVGFSGNPSQRMKQHQSLKSFTKMLVVERMEDEYSARAKEKLLITALCPRDNRQGL